MSHRTIAGILMFGAIGLFLPLSVASGLAAAEPPGEPSAAGQQEGPRDSQEPAPSYETEGDYYLGYRWESSAESLKAAEYIYPHPSMSFGLNLLSCPLPYRYHVNAEYLNKHDLYSDAGFAYKDLVLFRDILVGVHRNLDHYYYQYPKDPLSELRWDDRDEGDVYSDAFTSNLATLRLKVPDYPFHTFVNHRHIEKDGLVQQRFLLGSFNSLNKTSESRTIDWSSDAVKLGANSHTGPVEIEYAYDFAKLDPGQDHILFDLYPASTSGNRPSDIYPHNVIAETESSANSLKLHSSYTGGLVAGAMVSQLSEKNNYSQTEATTWKQAFDLSWIPEPMLGLFLKYRHRDMDVDTLDATTLVGASNTLFYPGVRENISYDKDAFSLSSRYRPMSLLALFATYDFTLINRHDVADWIVIPDQTRVHTLTLAGQAKPLAQIKCDVSYEYSHYEQPQYNDTPDNANKLRLTTTYTPTPEVTAYLEYILSITERDSLLYLNNNPFLLLETGGRDGRNDQLLASVSTSLSASTALTASWFYQRWDIEQDLAYGKRLGTTGDLPFIDANVPYSDEANSFSLSLSVIPRPDITVGTAVTYTIIKGKPGYNDVVGGAPFSLSSFSNLKASETTISFDVGKKLSEKWEIGLRSHLDIYNDREYGVLDGNIFTTTCLLKRYL